MTSAGRNGTTRPDGDFLLRQKVYDAFRDIEQQIRLAETIIAVHPDDLTDEMRQMIEAVPFTTLRESTFIRRGELFVISPGLLGDLNGR